MVRLLWIGLVALGLLLGAVAEDAAIAARIKAKLVRSKIGKNGLVYRVEDGTVEWTGRVAIPQHKGAATRMAKTAGARRVVNRIVVEAKPQEKAMPRKVTVRVPQQ